MWLTQMSGLYSPKQKSTPDHCLPTRNTLNLNLLVSTDGNCPAAPAAWGRCFGEPVQKEESSKQNKTKPKKGEWEIRMKKSWANKKEGRWESGEWKLSY